MSTERPPHFVSHRYMWFVYYTDCDRTYCCTHLGFVSFSYSGTYPRPHGHALLCCIEFHSIHLACPYGQYIGTYHILSILHDTHRSPPGLLIGTRRCISASYDLPRYTSLAHTGFPTHAVLFLRHIPTQAKSAHIVELSSSMRFRVIPSFAHTG